MLDRILIAATAILLAIVAWSNRADNATLERLKEREWAYELCISEINNGDAYRSDMFAQCVADYRDSQR